jgi:O-succinylbenzoate synthase
VELTEHRLRLPDGAGGWRDVILLKGPQGWGECSPFAGYPCDPSVARHAAEAAATVPWPAAVRETVAVNALVPGPEVDVAALAGYPVVKVKMRTPADVRLVAAVRDAVGPGVELRVDANGAWDVETAADVIAQLAPHGVALVEQPVVTLEELAELHRRVSIPLAADECVRTVADARRLRTLDAADAVVLKVQPLGGIQAALEIAAEAGVPAIPTSMMETSVGIAVGLALAAALDELPYACGLGTASLLEADITTEPLLAERGRLRVRRAIPDATLLARYSTALPSRVNQVASTSATSAGRSR